MRGVVLLLLLLALDPLRASSPRPHTDTPIRYFPGVDDYDYEDATGAPSAGPGASTTPPSSPRECEYDACAAPGVPCAVVSARTGCYCPGIAGPDRRPAAPRLRELRRGGRGELEVRWCAPQSTVTRYEVVVDGVGGTGRVFGRDARWGAVPGVAAGARVCVIAANGAGVSDESEESCRRFEEGGVSTGVAAGVAVGGVVSLVLIAAAAATLWRRRNAGKSDGATAGEGLGNPSYTTNEAL